MQFWNKGAGKVSNSLEVSNNQPLPVAVGMPEIKMVSVFTCPTATTSNAAVITAGNVRTTCTRIIILNTHATAPAYLNNTAPTANTDGMRLAVGESWHCRPDAVPYGIGTAAATLQVIQVE